MSERETVVELPFAADCCCGSEGCGVCSKWSCLSTAGGPPLLGYPAGRADTPASPGRPKPGMCVCVYLGLLLGLEPGLARYHGVVVAADLRLLRLLRLALRQPHALAVQHERADVLLRRLLLVLLAHLRW
jgi:hypothetical protein